MNFGIVSLCSYGELDSAGSGWNPVAGFYEHGNETSDSIKKAGYFLTS
jgi:hypothetical protein